MMIQCRIHAEWTPLNYFLNLPMNDLGHDWETSSSVNPSKHDIKISVLTEKNASFFQIR